MTLALSDHMDTENITTRKTWEHRKTILGVRYIKRRFGISDQQFFELIAENIERGSSTKTEGCSMHCPLNCTSAERGGAYSVMKGACKVPSKQYIRYLQCLRGYHLPLSSGIRHLESILNVPTVPDVIKLADL